MSLRVEEDRKECAIGPTPDRAGLDRFSRHRAAAPLRAHLRSAMPGAVAARETADPFQHKADECGNVRASIGNEPGKPTKFAFMEVGQGANGMLGKAVKARRVEQKAAVTQAIPTGQRAAVHVGAPGKRTSIDTGNTCAGPAMACRLGRRCLRMRSRSRSSCSRTSS